MRRSRALTEVQRRQREYLSTAETHGPDSPEAQTARARYREADHRYQMILLDEFEGAVLDEMSEGR
jgi:ATP:corrinoid adenosyltransferase